MIHEASHITSGLPGPAQEPAAPTHGRVGTEQATLFLSTSTDAHGSTAAFRRPHGAAFSAGTCPAASPFFPPSSPHEFVPSGAPSPSSAQAPRSRGHSTTAAGACVAPVTDLCIEAVGFERCRGNGEFYVEYSFLLSHTGSVSSPHGTRRAGLHPRHAGDASGSPVCTSGSAGRPASSPGSPRASAWRRCAGGVVQSGGGSASLRASSGRGLTPRFASASLPHSADLFPLVRQELELAVLPPSLDVVFVRSGESGDFVGELEQPGRPRCSDMLDALRFPSHTQLLFPPVARREAQRRPPPAAPAGGRTNDGGNGESGAGQIPTEATWQAASSAEPGEVEGRGTSSCCSGEAAGLTRGGQPCGAAEPTEEESDTAERRPRAEAQTARATGGRVPEVGDPSARAPLSAADASASDEAANPPPIEVRRRFQSFVSLHRYLVSIYPRVPPLPPKLPLLPLLTAHVQSRPPFWTEDPRALASLSRGVGGNGTSSQNDAASPAPRLRSAEAHKSSASYSLSPSASDLPLFSLFPPPVVVTPPRRRLSTSSSRLALQLVQQRQRQLVGYISALLQRTDIMGDPQVLAFFNVLPPESGETPSAARVHATRCRDCALRLSSFHPLRPFLLLQFRGGACRATGGVWATLAGSAADRGEAVSQPRRSVTGDAGGRRRTRRQDRHGAAQVAVLPSSNEAARAVRSPELRFLFLLHRTSSSFFSRIAARLQHRASAAVSPLRLQEEVMAGDAGARPNRRGELEASARLPAGRSSSHPKRIFKSSAAQSFKRSSVVTVTFSSSLFLQAPHALLSLPFTAPGLPTAHVTAPPSGRRALLLGYGGHTEGTSELDTSSEGTSVQSEREDEAPTPAAVSGSTSDRGKNERDAVASSSAGRRVSQAFAGEEAGGASSPIPSGLRSSLGSASSSPSSSPAQIFSFSCPGSAASSACASGAGRLESALGNSTAQASESSSACWSCLRPAQQELLNQFRQFRQECAGYLPRRASSCCFSPLLRLLFIGLSSGTIACGAVFPPALPALCSSSPAARASPRAPSAGRPLSNERISQPTLRWSDAGCRDVANCERHDDDDDVAGAAAALTGLSGPQGRWSGAGGSRSRAARAVSARASFSASSLPLRILPSATFAQTTNDEVGGLEQVQQRYLTSAHRRRPLAFSPDLALLRKDDRVGGLSRMKLLVRLRPARARSDSLPPQSSVGPSGVSNRHCAVHASCGTHRGDVPSERQPAGGPSRSLFGLRGGLVAPPAVHASAPAHGLSARRIPSFQPHRGSVAVLLTLDVPLGRPEETVTLLVSAARDRQLCVHLAATGELLCRQEIATRGAPRVARADELLRLLFFGCDDGSLCVYRLVLLPPSLSRSNALGSPKRPAVREGSSGKSDPLCRVRLVVVSVAGGGSPNPAPEGLASSSCGSGVDGRRGRQMKPGVKVHSGGGSPPAAPDTLHSCSCSPSPRRGSPDQTRTHCRDIEAMCLAPERQLLFTAASEGWVHVWRYHLDSSACPSPRPESPSGTLSTEPVGDNAQTPLSFPPAASRSPSTHAALSRLRQSPASPGHFWRDSVELPERSSVPVLSAESADRPAHALVTGVFPQPNASNGSDGSTDAEVAGAFFQRRSEEASSGGTPPRANREDRFWSLFQESLVRLELLGRLDCIPAKSRVGALAWWVKGSVLAVASTERRRGLLRSGFLSTVDRPGGRNDGMGGMISFVALGADPPRGLRGGTQPRRARSPLSGLWQPPDRDWGHAGWSEDSEHCPVDDSMEVKARRASDARPRLPVSGEKEAPERNVGFYGGMVCVWRAHAEGIVDLWMMEEEDMMMSVDKAGVVKLWLLPPVQ
ncbi:hypothetical protein BESB_046590 [Besnoitia besnoiti]|uniref:PX domain-containing protein n=1 Tax=Besnoitia besnoiti TaxID=94643 RepID=A0A2A9MLF2_BESBE|nr:hypothetical protein BESB_046590 [Besnoitia besnoiti]PFH36467.1 hypothetical protein BESB_046590 [Besnoitia besnoiti]